MLSGIIRNLHNNRTKTFATIEYDEGNKLIFYSAAPNTHAAGEFMVGEKVRFEEMHTEFGVVAKNLFKITEFS